MFLSAFLLPLLLIVLLVFDVPLAAADLVVGVTGPDADFEADFFVGVPEPLGRGEEDAVAILVLPFVVPVEGTAFFAGAVFFVEGVFVPAAFGAGDFVAAAFVGGLEFDPLPVDPVAAEDEGVDRF